QLHRIATSPAAREHVTAYITAHPTQFAIRHVLAASDDSDLRWTVDTTDDLALVRELYEQFVRPPAIPPYRALVAAVRAPPWLATANAHVVQKSWNHVG